MKKKIFITSLAVALTSGAISASIFSICHKNVEKTNAYTVSSLPSTINLNDSTPEVIKGYYSSLVGKDESELKGTNLLKNLKTILKNGQKYYSYDTDNNGRKIWQIYEIADRDWVRSPASDISGYNDSTKTITGYTYGTSASNSNGNPYIHALYVKRTVDNHTHAWAEEGTTTSNHGSTTGLEWHMDREHIWAKSQGFEAEGEAGARGDPMHLWAADTNVNSSLHNDEMYGYVDLSQSYTVGKFEYNTDNRRGKSLTLGTSVASDVVFEPQDSDKGDIARAIFYMVARYNYLSGSDSDGIDSNNPNLSLTQSNEVLTKYTSSTSVTGKMGIMTDLLAWHHADPVDQYEIHRNNLLYNNFTNNRNPFIDYPEWVDYIWGTATYDGRTYQSYNSTPTGYANPNTDVINGYKGDTPTPPDPAGDSETITMSEQGFSNQQEITTISGTSCSITFSKGTNSTTPKYYTTGSAVRAYGGNTFTVSSSRTIVGINLTFGSDDGSNTITTDKNTWASPSWTGSANSVTFTIGGTSGNRRISAIEVIYESSGSDEPTSITATANKNFSVGETITKSDITVKDNNNNVISDFSFANNNYKFTYNDAVSGGALTDKTFTDAITYGELSCSLTVKVQRANYQEVENIDRSLTSANKDFASVTATAEANADTYTITKNGIQYETTCSYRYNGNDILSFSDYKKDTKYASDGVFRNITKMPTNIISASFTYNGSNSPSIAATVEYSSDQNNWSTTPELDSYYFRIYFADIFTGYINIKAVNIVTAGQETARNTANYIMFEDTNNQCLTKLDYAIGYFNNMSATERSTFMTSDDYVISTARDRFDKWLISQGKSVSISGGDYVITANKNMVNALNSNNYIYLIITLTGVISISMVGFYFLLKKKKSR